MPILFQALDIYSTVQGTKYDCVREANPIFGEKPSESRLIWTKVALITPAIQYDLKKGRIIFRYKSESEGRKAIEEKEAEENKKEQEDAEAVKNSENEENNEGTDNRRCI